MDLREYILQKGLGELIPSWLEREKSIVEEKSSVARAKSLIEEDRLALANEQAREEISDLIRELRAQGRSDLGGELTSRLVQTVSSSDAESRARAAQSFSELFTLLENTNCLDTLESAANEILKTAEHEVDPNAYARFGEFLEKVAGRSLRERDYQRASQVINLLWMHVGAEEAFSRRRRSARESLKRMARTDPGDLLMQDLMSGKPESKGKAQALIVSLGEPMADRIIDTLKETTDLRLRKVLSLILKGKSSVNHVCGHYILCHELRTLFVTI